MVQFGTDIVNGSSYKPQGSPPYAKQSSGDILSENGAAGGGCLSDNGSNMSGSSKRLTRKERMDRRVSMANPKSNEENRLPTGTTGLPPRFGR